MPHVGFTYNLPSPEDFVRFLNLGPLPEDEVAPDVLPDVGGVVHGLPDDTLVRVRIIKVQGDEYRT